MMPRGRNPGHDHSKYEGDRRRERSISISSRNSSSDGEHSPMPYKKRKTENHGRFSRDGEKSRTRRDRSRSVRSHYSPNDLYSKSDNYSGSHFDDYRDSMLDVEESVDPSICNFRVSTLQNDTLEHRTNSGNDRLKRLEKIMDKIAQDSRTPAEQRHYGIQEHDTDHSNTRLKNLEKMIEKMLNNKTETSTFTVPAEPNGLVTTEELIPCNSNFTTSMWLSKINEECLERSFDEKTCIKFLESKMTGSVKSWYKTLDSNDLTWPELKMLITETFPDNSEFAALLRLLVNRFKKPDETITQYYFSKMYLIEACRISGVYAVSCLIDGLRDPKIQKDAKANNFLTPESLYSHYLDKLSDHDEPNHKGETDDSNHKGEMDGSNHKGEVDGPNRKGEKDGSNLKGGVDPPNHPNEHEKGLSVKPNPPNSGRTEPNPPNYGIPGPNPPNYGRTGPNPPNYGITEPNPPNYGIAEPNPPHYGLTGPNNPNYGITGPNLPNYGITGPDLPNYGITGPDFPHYGVMEPNFPNYGMGPHNYSQEFLPSHDFNGNYGMGQPHLPNFGMEPNYGGQPWQPDPYSSFQYPNLGQPDYGNNVSSGYMDGRPEVAIPKCLNCQELGHLSAYCRVPKKCSLCKKKGHIAPFCKNKVRFNVQASTEMFQWRSSEKEETKKGQKLKKRPGK